MPRGKTTKKKKPKRKTPTQKRRAQLVKELDNIFSKYIRLRDADKKGICRCITCGKPIPWHEGRKINCGHFMLRSYYATRWDEMNCNAQCVSCNNYKAGDQYRHGKAIDDKFGAGTADELVRKAHQEKGPVTAELYELITYYETKFKTLLHER